MSDTAILGISPEECDRQAGWHERQAAAWRQIADGVRLYRGDIPTRPVRTTTIVAMIRDALDTHERVKASELRVAAGGSKGVDASLRRLVDRGEAERLGAGWYRKVVTS